MVRRSLVIILITIASAFMVSAQTTTTIVPGTLSKPEVDAIIAKFTANEAAFREALTNYVFNRYATLSTIGLGGQTTGVYRRDSYMTFTSDGKRIEKILFAPVPTVPPGMVTAEDLDDLGGVNPFAIEPRQVPQYNFTYLGKEKIDELNLHVFEVTPKVIPDPKSKIRMFTGRVWVDDEDLMIVKSKGKAVPETKTNKFPVVETWREHVDGKYWFPSIALANEQLVFDNGSVLHIKMNVKYADYKMGRTEIFIGEEEDLPDDKPAPTPSPSPKKP
jgi:hypothetical protein